jgi:hypothetical protein
MAPSEMSMRFAPSFTSQPARSSTRLRLFCYHTWGRAQDNAPGSSWHGKGAVSIRAGAQRDVRIPHYDGPSADFATRPATPQTVRRQRMLRPPLPEGRASSEGTFGSNVPDDIRWEHELRPALLESVELLSEKTRFAPRWAGIPQSVPISFPDLEAVGQASRLLPSIVGFQSQDPPLFSEPDSLRVGRTQRGSLRSRV